MTKEDKVSLLLEVYEQEKERLNIQYQRRYMEEVALETKAKGHELTDETAAALIKLKEWREIEKAAIERRFKKAIIALEG
jgi:hypothetical protein